MIIGIDGNEANVTLRVGVSVYTLNLLRYFKKTSDDKIRFKVFLRNKPLTDLPGQNKYFTYEVVDGAFAWSQVFLPLRLFFKKDIDVFFSPAHYAPRFCPVPSVITIHDLSYLYYPEDFLKQDLYKLQHWTEYSIKQSAKIIAVSKTTKKDIIKAYSTSDDSIQVIYNGYQKRTGIQESKFKLKEITKPYFLYVGTLQPRKNILTLIQAFAQFKKLDPTFELIIAGKKGWMYERIFDEVSDLGLNHDVFFTDYVTDQQLAFLYENAYCFVLPSFYEGFGIPILEAMSYGCPVISSFSSSLPEVGDEACLYFDPNSVSDLVEKMQLIHEDSKLRKELIQKGKKRVKEFSWEKCGEETLTIIKSVCV